MTPGLDNSGRALRFLAGMVAVLGATVAIMVLMGPPGPTVAGAQAAAGGELYAQHCASCHQATGLGLEGTFPPIAGNPAAADPAYVEQVIREGRSGPIEVLGVAYDQPMPAVAALSDQADIDAVVEFVVGLAGRDSTPTTAAPTEPDASDGEEAGPVLGDVDIGHDLFIGADRFEAGGAACSGCHTAGEVGNLGGSSLGPDLTDSFDTLGGEAGLTGWLAAPPSETMRPIFAERPLNDAELAHVVAFLGDAPDQGRAATGLDRLAVAGAIGVLALIGGMAVVWRGMRQTYVEKIRSGR